MNLAVRSNAESSGQAEPIVDTTCRENKFPFTPSRQAKLRTFFEQIFESDLHRTDLLVFYRIFVENFDVKNVLPIEMISKIDE